MSVGKGLLILNQMEIKCEQPPNFKLLNEVFKLTNLNVYAYAPDIYNPNNCYLDPVVILHESVHIKQQGSEPATWWNRYLVDPSFRFIQESEAYAAQYKAICKKFKDRNTQARHLHTLATDLSSPTYGNVCSMQEAERVIKENIKFKV